MENKWTPGPWKSRPASDKNCTYAFVFQNNDPKDERNMIATVWDGDNHPPRAQARANSRLIAAAPDLLEALETIVDNCIFESEEHETKVRRAIAKARNG